MRRETVREIVSPAGKRQWTFTVCSENTLQLIEKSAPSKGSFVVDISNELWVAAAFSVGDKDVRFKGAQETIALPQGSYLLFKPVFSITELSFDSAITLTAILSRESLPEEAPTMPVLYKRNSPSTISTVAEVSALLQNDEPYRDVGRYNTKEVSGIAEKIKRYLDQHYAEANTLSSIADNLGISSNLLSMYFKESYHLAPSQYRKQLRLKASVLQLLADQKQQHSIADIANRCGYNDISRYNKQFKEFTTVTPKMVR